MKRYLYLLLLFVGFWAHAQEVRVIDKKGTIRTVTVNNFTEDATAPTAPVEGDVWFDTTTNISKVYDADTTSWKVIDPDSVTVDAIAPTIPAEGDIWFDTNENLTKVWDGTSTWQPIQAITAYSLWDNDLDTGIQVEESPDDDHIRFDTRSIQRMVIDTVGRVGIGKDVPEIDLHVGGSAILEDSAPNLTLKSISGNGLIQQTLSFETHNNQRGGGIEWLLTSDTDRKAYFGQPYRRDYLVYAYTQTGEPVAESNDPSVLFKIRHSNGFTAIGGSHTPRKSLDVGGEARIQTLPLGAATDSIVTANVDGDLRKQSISDLAAANEPWFTEGTTTGHTLNTGNMFFSGNVAVGTNTLSAGKVATFAGDVDIQGVLDPTKLIFSGDGSIGSFDPTTDNQYEIEFQEGRALRFKSDANANIMHLANNGNVGIGTPNPTEKLTIQSGDILVNNDLVADRQINLSTTSVIDLNTVKEDLVLMRYISPNNINAGDGFAGSLIDFRAKGGSEIWTTAQILGLADAGGGGWRGGLAFATQDGSTTDPDGAGPRTKGANPVVRMVIQGDGDVGIGVAQPKAKLDVNGNTRLRSALLDADGDAGSAGQVLSSTATGTDWINTTNTITNELIFDGEDDPSGTYDDYYYISMLINGTDWKVVRYDKTDVNAEAEATITNNPGVTAQPTTLAACITLTF